MNRARMLVFVTIVVSLVAGWALRATMSGETIIGKHIDELSVLEGFSPLGTRFGPKGGVPLHYRADDGTVAYNTHDVMPHIRGYAGHISTLVVLGADGEIKGVRILSHKETVNYVHTMLDPGYISSFEGKTVNDAFVVGEDLDAISRATVSVEALARTVRESSRMVGGEVMGLIPKVPGSAGSGAGASLGWVVMLALYGLAMAAYAFNYRQYVRDAIMLSSVLVVGFWLSSPFAALHFFNIILGRVSNDPLWLVTAVGAVVSVVLAGRLYCGWICPLGAIMEFAGRFPARKWLISINADERYRRAKYLLLAMMSVVVLVSGRTDFGAFEPYVTLFSYSGTALAWMVLIISVGGSLWVPRFWCRYLCPAGALFALVCPVAHGMRSTRHCPMGNPPSQPVEGGGAVEHASECIRCGRCKRNMGNMQLWTNNVK